jgi:MFS family permease
MGVLVAAVAALAIIYVWCPMFPLLLSKFVTEPSNSWVVILASIVTVIGIYVALKGYIHPVKKYLSRSEAAQDSTVEKDHSTMRHLLLGAGLAAVALLGTWGSAQQAPRWASYLMPAGSTFPLIEYAVILTAIGAIIVTIITPLVADRLGRRITYTLLCAASLVIALAFFNTHTTFEGGHPTTWFYISAFLLGGITASFYGFFPLYFPELFPTSVRATGQGFCFNFGRLVAAIGALQLGNLVGLFGTEAKAYSILSSVYLIGMVLIWFCPETKGKKLE